jgi:uncharacterized membrane protein YphA (DoxX/SURF4 family)
VPGSTGIANTRVPVHAERRDLPLALLRIAIGWHFLYEGWSKLLQPGWTSSGYLKGSTGPLGVLFGRLASHHTLVRITDQLNVWGLVLIGLGLMLGLFIRPLALSGVALLSLYYLAYPPLFAPFLQGVREGNYLVVNKNLVELAALAVVAALPAAAFGLDGWLAWKRAVHQADAGESDPPRKDRALPALRGVPSRREVLAGLVGIPFVGGLLLAVLKKHGWQSFEEIYLKARPESKGSIVISTATVKTFQYSTVSDLKGRLPYGRIGNVALSRMILGGNLIGGWAHARDLIYVSQLVKSYHDRDKVFETFALAERCGINTILTSPLLSDIIHDYWREGGSIQFISDCGGGKDLLQNIARSIDRGACACYIHGAVGDSLVEAGKFDVIDKALAFIRTNRLPAGIGGHKLQTVRGCCEKGLRPDFWMKTLHHRSYWSASPQPEQDNTWCEDPSETIALMNQLEQPWIAYKVLAAGAIHPKVGFRYAFEAGADFICVGIYDFQIVDDVNIASATLNTTLRRGRPWRA